MLRYPLFIFFALLPLLTIAQQTATEHVVVITFDGLRWQEVFGGADKKLIRSEKYSKQPEALKAQYWHSSYKKRRELLMPFFWSTLASQGELIGNRRKDSKMKLTTKKWKSYPGYNELLSGYADPYLTRNAKIHNQNVTVLEWLNQQPEFRGKVAVFGSWDVFPYIINTERSRVHVNAGNMPARGANLTPTEQALNNHLATTTPRWESVRRDSLTFRYAMEYLQKERPRVLYLALGETDEHAHEGNYNEYLHATRQSDAMIQELWEWLQSDEQYKGKTTLLIATDHGRGHLTKKSFTKHGRFHHPGSNHVWMATMGPDTAPVGESEKNARYYQYQVAGKIANLLGLTFTPHQAPGPSISANPSGTAPLQD